MLNKYHVYKNKLRMSVDRKVLFEESYATLELLAVSSAGQGILHPRPTVHFHSKYGIELEQ